jgi:hypothetical protein
MDTTPGTQSNRRRIAMILLMAGAVLMILGLGLTGLPFLEFVRGSLMESVGASAGLGLAVLHHLQAAVFNHGVLFSWAYRFLVLFSAFGMMGTGLALSRKKTTELDRRS